MVEEDENAGLSTRGPRAVGDCRSAEMGDARSSGGGCKARRGMWAVMARVGWRRAAMGYGLQAEGAWPTKEEKPRLWGLRLGR